MRLPRSLCSIAMTHQECHCKEPRKIVQYIYPEHKNYEGYISLNNYPASRYMLADVIIHTFLTKLFQFHLLFYYPEQALKHA